MKYLEKTRLLRPHYSRARVNGTSTFERVPLGGSQLVRTRMLDFTEFYAIQIELTLDYVLLRNIQMKSSERIQFNPGRFFDIFIHHCIQSIYVFWIMEVRSDLGHSEVTVSITWLFLRSIPLSRRMSSPRISPWHQTMLCVRWLSLRSYPLLHGQWKAILFLIWTLLIFNLLPWVGWI